ncbi:MAG TPA: hypothetical protein VD768_05505 [Sphingomicrobium sp.]|nr:hypothetical protein [Sphingomicrobium sp.]
MPFLPFTLTAAFALAPAAVAPSARETPHYAFGATVVPADGLIAVDLLISFPSGSPAAELVLGEAYQVTAAEAGPGNTVTVEKTDKPWGGLQRIAARFAGAAGRPALRLRYSGPLNPSGEPPLNMITPALTELNLDSMWLPVASDLGSPFTVDARIGGLPADAVVVSQGVSRRTGDEVRVQRPFPDSDFAFVAAPGLQRVSGPEFELLARDLQSPRAALFREHGTASIRFLESWLGPMPNKPARLVVVSRPRASGYARKGYVVFTEGNKSSDDGVAKFTAHEFAHAWFAHANPLTEHRWIDESIAEYVAIRYVERAFGERAAAALFESKVKAAGAAPAILKAPPDGDAIYAKGPLLLRELEGRIGRAQLDSVIAESARLRIGDTAAFLDVLAARSSAADAAWFAGRLKDGPARRAAER